MNGIWMKMATFKKDTNLEFTETETFKSELADRLCSQRKQGIYCDLELVVDGQTVPVHKGVLVARCDYFAAMFSHAFCEDSMMTVDMSHVFPTVAIMDIILDYMYTGKIILNEGNIEDVLESASHLLLDSLGRHCAQYLLSNLGPHNCVNTWAIADTYNMPELALIARNMCKSRFQDSILEQEQSLYIPGNFLLRLTQEAMPQMYNVKSFVKFLLMWGQTEKSEENRVFLKGILDTRPELYKYREDILQKLTSTESEIGTVTSAIKHLKISTLTSECRSPIESLVTYTIKGSLDSSDIRLHVYAFLPNDYTWVRLGIIYTSMPFFNSQCELVGAAGENLIFKASNPHRILSMTLANKEHTEIQFPSRHMESLGLVTYKQFCYDQQVFCIMEEERRTSLRSAGQRPNRTLSEWDFSTVRSLMVYNPSSKTWLYCCDIPLVEIKGGQRAALDYHIIDSGEVAYIWAMDMYWHEDSGGGGPFWMKLYSTGVTEEFNYHLILEPTPPVSSQEWGYKQVKLMGSEQGIMVYGYSHHCNMCVPMLLYNTHIRAWSVLEELMIHYPHVVLPLLGGTFGPESVYISQNTVQSLSSGLIYHLEDLCPFVSRFWALDIDTIEWKELPAPPVTGLRNFMVCRVDNNLLLHSEQIREDPSLLPDESTLLYCRLPDSAGCFLPITPSRSSSEMPEGENSFIMNFGMSDIQTQNARDSDSGTDIEDFVDALSDM